MGRRSNPDERVVKPAGRDARLQKLLNGPTMHGSTGEFNLMAGAGSLIKHSGGHVKAAGEKPGGGKQR